jgi:phenylacetate-coenzyme A ligase PaaK-like adenylate-forming protein
VKRKPTDPPSEQKLRAARARLDAHVREIVNWHFDPRRGTPFWIEFARKLGWNPRKEIRCFDDLKKLPSFEDEWLRGGPVRRWVPRALADKPLYVFETGGTTGIPKGRIAVEDWRIDYTMMSDTLPDRFFPRGSNWLMLGPSGPRRLRLAIEHLAQVRGGICFCIDLDPRWVIKLIKRGAMQELELYKNHCIEQALTILKAGHDIRCMFATPKLLEALCEKINLRQAGVTGIFCGGTSMTPQFHRWVREELLGPDIYFAPTYGNTLMGLAVHKPFVPEDRYSIIYHPPHPRAILEVVDPKDPNRLVGYGEVGRVKLTTLTREFFVPGFLERDQAYRTPPIELYPWDGVRDVAPFQQEGQAVVEGVY